MASTCAEKAQVHLERLDSREEYFEQWFMVCPLMLQNLQCLVIWLDFVVKFSSVGTFFFALLLL